MNLDLWRVFFTSQTLWVSMTNVAVLPMNFAKVGAPRNKIQVKRPPKIWVTPIFSGFPSAWCKHWSNKIRFSVDRSCASQVTKSMARKTLEIYSQILWSPEMSFLSTDLWIVVELRCFACFFLRSCNSWQFLTISTRIQTHLMSII